MRSSHHGHRPARADSGHPLRLARMSCRVEGFGCRRSTLRPALGPASESPPGNEPAGCGARFRRYGDLTELPGSQALHGCTWRVGMMRLGCRRGRPMPCPPRLGCRRAGGFSVVGRAARVCERRRTKPSIRRRHGPSVRVMRGDGRITIMVCGLRLLGCRRAALGRCRRARRSR
jgi:hypothetical protein